MKKVILFICLIPLTVLAGSFTESLERYRNLTAGADAYRVSGYELVSANSTLVFDGVMAPLKAGDETLGFVFEGDGSISIQLARGPFYEANKSTLFENHSLKPDENDRVRETFKEAVVLVYPLPDKLFEGEQTSSKGLQDVLDKQLARLDKSVYGLLDHDIAPVVMNPYPEQVVYAMFENKDARYYCEPNYENIEYLGYWKETQERNYNEQVVFQPVTFDPKERPQSLFRQTHIDLELTSNDNIFMKEKSTSDFVAKKNGLNVVALRVTNGRSRSWRTLWKDRKDQFSVTRIVDGSGKELEFSHRYDHLLVRLPKTMSAGETFKLTIEAEGNLLKNYEGDSYLVLGNFYYYPQADDLHATFHSIVKVKDPYVALGCGINNKRWKEGDLNCLETTEDRPVDFPFLVVGNFEYYEKETDDYDVKVYSYVMGKEKAGRKLVKNGLAILDYFSSGLVTFPYHEMEVVEIPYQRHFFWQAPSGVVEITSEAFNPIGSGDEADIDTILRRMFSQEINERYAHEVAHQWFGNLVGIGSMYDNWISEAHAEYLSYMFTRDGMKDKRKTKRKLNDWKMAVDRCGDKSSVYGAPAADNHYTCLIYGKGPYVLHALQQEIGEDKFYQVMKILSNGAMKNKHLKAITEDYILVVNHVTGKDYRPWFDKYIYGSEVPEWKEE